MICETCRAAGEANTSARAETGRTQQRHWLNKAKRLHKGCRGCPCKHKTGDGHLNMQLIEEHRTATTADLRSPGRDPT